MITPLEIRQKAARAYPRVLAQWVKGELDGFFPWTVAAEQKLKGSIVDERVYCDSLRAESKNEQGWGYTVHWAVKRKREYGTNSVPMRIAIDTLEDFLRLANKRREFRDTCRVANRLREEFPKLADWLASNISKVHLLSEPLEGLIAVTRFFLHNPWPDCYARQIPVAVDTKFVERHRTVLRAWLDALLPASAIQVDESKFALRFGLRNGQLHTAVRTLDSELQAELDLRFDEFSAPLWSLATLPVSNATVFIVENRLNLLTLPPFQRGIAICGEGDAVTRLRKLQWIGDNRVIYWGDIDVRGFHILSRLRGLFPNTNVRSIMMDCATLSSYGLNDNRIITANADPPHLADKERAAFLECVEQHRWVEQEKIPQAYVEERIRDLAEICYSDPTSDNWVKSAGLSRGAIQKVAGK